MIRRVVGSEWWLFTQEDHARLAGDFARHLGGMIQPLSPAVCAAIAMHDAGWTDRDDQPTLNPQGQPIDVFETPLVDGLETWRKSSARALATGGACAGLLVSVHSLALSAHAATKVLKPPVVGPPDFKMHFAINKFQHAEVEQQENCRRQLGMRLDAPLTLGLAAESIEPAEQQLIYDFRWLQAMDQLSLDACCTSVMFPTLNHVQRTPGGEEFHINVSRTDHGSLCVRPWPFEKQHVAASIRFRRLPVGHFTSVEAFRTALGRAAVEELVVQLFPPGPLAATA